jgi:hypothetical protein
MTPPPCAHPSPSHGKRERPASVDDLAALDGASAPPAKHVGAAAAAADNLAALDSAIAPPAKHEAAAAYFSRLRAAAQAAGLAALLSPATAFDRDDVYVYKRPVRSAGEHAALLASGGSVFHHVVVVAVRGAEIHTLEYGPVGGADITEALAAEAEAGPVLAAGPPADLEPACLPALHIDVEPHAPHAPHVAAALEHAQRRPYHALRNNCIAFADAAVRVLTGGLVRGAPLLFDAFVGRVPDPDPPLLPLLAAVAGVTWFDICDGGRLMREMLHVHGEAFVVPLPKAPRLLPLAAAEDDTAPPRGEPSAAAAAKPGAGAQPPVRGGLKALPRPPSQGACGAWPLTSTSPCSAATTKP